MIFVTHRLSLLNACDEVLVMEDGEIISHGPPEEIGAYLYGSRTGKLHTTMLRADEIIEEEPVDILQILPKFAMRAQQR